MAPAALERRPPTDLEANAQARGPTAAVAAPGWRVKPTATLWLGVAIVGALIAAALVAPLVAPHNPLQEKRVIYVDGRWVTAPFAPGPMFPLGTDSNGRDVLSNLLYGARYTLTIAGLVVIARLMIGVLVGSIAGWHRGRPIDQTILALSSVFGSFPALLLGMVAILAFDIRVGLQTFVVALSLTGWAELAQFMRGEVISLKARPFVDGARVVGLTGYGIALRHLAPNLAPGLVALAALEMSGVLILLGELGFVGIFVGGGTRFVDVAVGAGGRETASVIAQFATPEWGALTAQARATIFSSPWVAVYPAVAFFVAVLGFNLLGRGLRQALEQAELPLARIVRWRYLAAIVAAAVAINLLTTYTGEAATLTGYARAIDGHHAWRDAQTLSQPAWAGRRAGTPGEWAAADWLAAQMAEIGLEPAGDRETYFQNFQIPIVDLAAMPAMSLVHLDGAPARAMLPRIDFREAIGGFAGIGDAAGQLVFLGAGLDEPQFSEYRGVDVVGKIGVLMGGPRGKDPIENALKRKLAAVMYISRDETGDSLRLRPSYLPHLSRETLPVITVSREVGAYLLGITVTELKELQKNLDEMAWNRGRGVLRTRDLPYRAAISVPAQTPSLSRTQNVLGVLPGIDEGRRDRYVIIGAHFDGVGDEPDGVRYDGANDNASGTAVLLEVARQMKRQGIQPQNTVMFAAFTGEEAGLLGSEHFVSRGRIKSTDIAAYINLDVVGQGRGDAVAIGDETYSLYVLAKNAADRLGIATTNTAPYGGSSDHATFLNRRVPVVNFYWPGFDGMVHTPLDRADNLDPEKMRKVGMVAYQTLLQLAVTR